MVSGPTPTQAKSLLTFLFFELFLLPLTSFDNQPTLDLVRTFKMAATTYDSQ